jgi:hypothetical protein
MTYEELKRKAEELIELRENGARREVRALGREDGEDDLERRARRAWDAIHETG